MEGIRFLRNSQIIILGVCIAAATVAASVVLSRGFLKVMRFTREQITVTGSAQQEIKSDRIVWTASFSRRDSDVATAYKMLKADLEKTLLYLKGKGLNEKEIDVQQVVMTKIFRKNERGNDTSDIQGYLLTQKIRLESEAVEKITEISKAATELLNEGIEFDSEAPEYFYTKLDELKISMLALAAENARQRAESMTAAAGNKIGCMRSARMGVFQITPVNSTFVADWGVNDTSALEKKVTAVVTASFAIE